MTSAEIPDDPLSVFSLAVFRINGLLLRSGDIVTKAIGQSSARWQVLGRAGYEAQTVAQMARDMGHARQSVQRIADVLEAEGLVAYRDNPADKRARLVELTPKGAQVLEAIYALDQEWSQSIMAQLDPAQLVQIAEALDTISQVFEADARMTGKQVDNEES